jgi:hypothetical protein
MGRTNPRGDPTLTDLPMMHMGHLTQLGALTLTDLPVMRTDHLSLRATMGVSILLFLSCELSSYSTLTFDCWHRFRSREIHGKGRGSTG